MLPLPFFKIPPSALPPPRPVVLGDPADAETWRTLLRSKSRGSAERSTTHLHKELGYLVGKSQAQGTDLNTLSLDGRSILGHALSCRAFWAVAPLIQAGFRPHAGEPFLTDILTHLPDRWKLAWRVRTGIAERNADGETPLHRAAFGAKVSAITALLEEGAAPAARDNQGRTPLHRAWDGESKIRSESAEAAGLLLAAGARWDARDAKESTPFHRLLHTFPARPVPPEFDFGTLGPTINALDATGLHPLSIVLRASAVDFRDANTTRFRKPPSSPLPWLKGLAELGANPLLPNADGTTPGADFAAWVGVVENRRSDGSLPPLHPMQPSTALADGRTRLELRDETARFWMGLELQHALPGAGRTSRPRL